MGQQFYETVIGKEFFEIQLPRLINNLELIAKCKNLTEHNNRIYVCYHENSAALEPENGKVSDMIATTDIKGALVWLNDCIRNAKDKCFYFVQTDDVRKLYEALVFEQKYESIVYKNGDIDNAEFFKICVNSSYVS